RLAIGMNRRAGLDVEDRPRDIRPDSDGCPASGAGGDDAFTPFCSRVVPCQATEGSSRRCPEWRCVEDVEAGVQTGGDRMRCIHRGQVAFGRIAGCRRTQQVIQPGGAARDDKSRAGGYQIDEALTVLGAEGASPGQHDDAIRGIELVDGAPETGETGVANGLLEIAGGDGVVLNEGDHRVGSVLSSADNTRSMAPVNACSMPAAKGDGSPKYVADSTDS